MKIWSLQALRFWAALSVVLYHACNEAWQSGYGFGILGLNGAQFGRVGVDIFFVLSGVIITLTARGLSAGDFIARRARRILPLYAPLAIVCLIGQVVAGQAGWREALTSLTLWPAFDRIVEPPLPVAWTLCFEVLFYAAAALVVWRPKLIWALLGLYAAALASRSGPVLQFVGNPIVLEFLMGVGLARLPKWRGAVWFIPLGVAATLLLGPSGYPPNLNVPDFLAGTGGWSRVLYLGLPAALIVWGTMQIEGRRGVLAYLGDASYALYLIHLPVVIAVVWLFDRFAKAPPDLVALTAAAASVALAWRVHELFEKPLLNWARRPRAVRALA